MYSSIRLMRGQSAVEKRHPPFENKPCNKYVDVKSCVVPDLHHFLFFCSLFPIFLLLLPFQLHLCFTKTLTEKNVFQGYIAPRLY